MSDLLGQALKLPCGVEIPNRILKSAMTEGLADVNDCATEAHNELYRAWSNGGAGTLITGNVMIDRRFLERPGNVVVDGPRGLESLKRWAQAGTTAGNQLWMQISHPGRQCARISSNRPMAPSEVQLKLLGNFARPRAMTVADIEAAIAGWATTASVAKEAGFTGVQVHGAHGYLCSQFLSPIVNKRTDEWGGSLENRARLLLEAIRSVRAAVGDDYPLSVKLNSADFQKGGFNLDESMQVAKWLEAEAVDLLEISGGTYEQASMMGETGRDVTTNEPLRESTVRREAYFIEYASRMREAVSLRLAVTGGFRTRQSMEDALEQGVLDVVGLARPLCVEPDLPARLIQRKTDVATAYEQSLRLGPGWLGPHSPLATVKTLNMLGILGWFYQRIIDLSKGELPNVRMSVFRALVQHVSGEMARGIKRRRVLKREGIQPEA